jgi:hypothetical protein
MEKRFNHLPLLGASLSRKWMFKHTLTQPHLPAQPDCVFPIVTIENGDVKLLGTGFYITIDGLFVTAKHVLFDVLDMIGTQVKPISILHFTPNNQYIFRPILRSWSHDNADISVAVAAPMIHPIKGPLKNGLIPITFEKAAVNDDIVTYAYPNFNYQRSGKTQMLFFRPEFYDGRIVEHHKNGRDKSRLNWECYETDMHIHGGASGGPVINSKGQIFAINTSSFEPYTNVSYVTPMQFIEEAFVQDAKFDDENNPRDVSIKELIARKSIIIE